jgi:hypothetical protein
MRSNWDGRRGISRFGRDAQIDTRGYATPGGDLTERHGAQPRPYEFAAHATDEDALDQIERPAQDGIGVELGNARKLPGLATASLGIAATSLSSSIRKRCASRQSCGQMPPMPARDYPSRDRGTRTLRPNRGSLDWLDKAVALTPR